MADDPSPRSAAAQRAAARMAARADAAARAEAEGRDPVQAARDAARSVTERERRGRRKGGLTSLRGTRSGLGFEDWDAADAPRGGHRPDEPSTPGARRLRRTGADPTVTPNEAVVRDRRDRSPRSGLAQPASAGPRSVSGDPSESVSAGAVPAEPLPDDPEPIAVASVDPERDAPAASRSRSTAIFSVLTMLSRVAGLLREIIARGFYGTTGPMSAFTLAFQIPNLLRSLFADAALSAAFVPVFTDLLQQGRRRDAMKLAAELAWVVLLGLSALVAVSILLSPVVVPLFVDPDKMSGADTQLAVTLTQVMFPVVALLGINGLLVGILNAEDHFTIPALSPVVWNVLIIACMVVTHLALDDLSDQLYGYAIGVLIGTAAQLAMAIPLVRRSGFSMGRPRVTGARDPQVRHVLTLMVPVALGLGLVNFNLLVNTTLGFRISEQVPAAIDAAFRLYMLPQGIFSVAIATVLFPALSRAAARTDHADLRELLGDGMRQILVLLIPAAAVTIALAAPIIRLIYEHGRFDAQSAALSTDALWVFSLTLPLNGLNLLLTRTFFALKEPWTTTRIAVVSLVVNVVVSFALYRPLGIGGIVAGTVAANVAVVGTQLLVLRGRLGGSLGLLRTVATGGRVLVAAGALTLVVLAVDGVVRGVIGGSTLALVFSLGAALAAGTAVYVVTLRALRVEEAVRLERAIRVKLGR